MGKVNLKVVCKVENDYIYVMNCVSVKLPFFLLKCCIMCEVEFESIGTGLNRLIATLYGISEVEQQDIYPKELRI